MRSIVSFILLGIVASLLFISDAQAIGLGVEPGKISLSNVPLGKKVAVSKLGGEAMLLRIENKSASAFTYTIEILPTSKPGDLRAGYTDIPDTSWLWPEKKVVRIAGGSTEAVELYLKIPKVKKYYNKKYQAVIEVKSKKERPEDLFVLACQVRLCFSTERLEKKVERKAQVTNKYPRTITIIKTQDKWGGNLSFLSTLKREFPNIKVRELDYLTKKGKKLAEKLKIDFLPAYLFGKDIEKNKRFSSLTKANLIRPLGRRYYLISSGTNQSGIFIKRERAPHTLEVFSMSQCPFSAAALNKLITAQKEGRLSEDLKLDCHYIATLIKPCKPCGESPDTLKFQSLHGQPEVEEDIRQLCIQKYQPDKFGDYLLLRNRDIQSADWQTPAKQAAIDTEALKRCSQNNEGFQLLKEDIKRAQALRISASPTFLYENRILIMGLNLLKELPGLEGLEITTGEK